MKIDLTKKQYETMIKMLYLGEWIINSQESNMEENKYEKLLQHVYSKGKEIDKDELYVEYDEDDGKYYETMLFEEEMTGLIDEFEENYFWHNLSNRLAKNELYKNYSVEEISEMDETKFFKELNAIIKKFNNEFDENGLSNLKLKEKISK